jgi:hypothetical protein
MDAQALKRSLSCPAKFMIEKEWKMLLVRRSWDTLQNHEHAGRNIGLLQQMNHD